LGILECVQGDQAEEDGRRAGHAEARRAVAGREGPRRRGPQGPGLEASAAEEVRIPERRRPEEVRVPRRREDRGGRRSLVRDIRLAQATVQEAALEQDRLMSAWQDSAYEMADVHVT